MRIHRAIRGGVTGLLCGLVLFACGGGGYGSGGSTPPPPAAVTMSVSPTSVSVGQTATVTWSSSVGSSCTASGAWSGTQSTSGHVAVTPTAAGSEIFTLSCSGGGYGSGSVTGSATLTVKAASAFSLTHLVADTAGGTAANVDANLVNPWGLSIPAGSFFAWVANNHTSTSTLYDGNGKPQPHAAPLVLTFAAGTGGVTFDPTGLVFNGSAVDFMITKGAQSGAASFIFDGEGGMLAGWAPGVNAGQPVTVYADTTGAVYKGLAIAQNGGLPFVYATDFHNSKVDVFDTHFVKQASTATAFTFADTSIPTGYAPFGIQALATGTAGATQIYVAYAKQKAPDNHDNVDGAGLGYVDVFDTNGKFVKQLIATGALNAPWGLALAPADFGAFGGRLLVGNFGDGKINAYDPVSGTFAGTVADASGAAIATPGLWGIAFGNDANNQPHNTLFYAAGTNNEANGSFGRIDVGATPPVLNAAPVVTLTAPAGNLKGTVPLSATVKDALSVAKVEFFANNVPLGAPTAPPYAVNWDTTKVADGSVTVKATATDVDGNVGSSPDKAVPVANTAPPPVTLSQLQAAIFSPICSVCHTGVGGTLPGVQNLSAGHTFANVVNVASLEQPSLLRIKPNDAANSYLIQKIEGVNLAPGTARMPFGCPSAATPCLTPAQIDMVKAWVNQGALNN